MGSENAEARRGARMAEPGVAPEAMAEDAGRVLTGGIARVGFAPIVRVDAPSREVELCATSEALDSYGTVFDYSASKDAFTRWAGNVREMHDRRAVGRRVLVRCDDESRKIFVRVRISRGAQDTWEKVLDGTLRGASIGASNVVWERRVRRIAGGERPVSVATRYDLVELSLVDNPSNPDALGIAIVRDAVPDVALLDDLESGQAEAESVGEPYIPHIMPALSLPQRERARRERTARPSRPRAEPASAPAVSAPASSLWGADAQSFGPVEARIAQERASRGWAELAERVPVQPDVAVPGCLEMPHVREALHRQTETRLARHETPRDRGGVGERLHAAARELMRGCRCPRCAGALAALGETEEMRGAGIVARDEPAVATAVARALAAGLSASVERLESMDESVRGMRAIVQAAVSQMAGTAGDLRLRLDALERQPAPGGPVARPVEKISAFGAPGESAAVVDQVRALESLAGRISDPQAQIAVAAEIIRLRQAGQS